MQRIYQVTIHGRVLESCDLKKLLSRAVHEKKIMDRRIRMLSEVRLIEGAAQTSQCTLPA